MKNLISQSIQTSILLYSCSENKTIHIYTNSTKMATEEFLSNSCCHNKGSYPKIFFIKMNNK